MFITSFTDEELLPLSQQIRLLEQGNSALTSQRRDKLTHLLNREFTRGAIKVMEYLELSKRLRVALNNNTLH